MVTLISRKKDFGVDEEIEVKVDGKIYTFNLPTLIVDQFEYRLKRGDRFNAFNWLKDFNNRYHKKGE
tara:strand:- start:1190 stop:1390 length:201 start_codon:yes stop_codon:yes gene_type:complete